MTTADFLPTPSVSITDGRPATTSIDIAKHFGKRHDHVVRSIKDLMANCPETFTAPNFGVSEYTDETGRSLPMYTVFFDGFMLLVMGYTGKKALGMKLAYIEAFNAMREQLEGKKSAPRQRRSRKALPASEQLALPAHDPVQEEIEALLKRIEFYTKEVDLAGEAIATIMARESINEPRTVPGRIGNPYYDFHLGTSTSVRFLFSSINFNLNAVRDIIRIRRAYGI